MQSPLCVKSLDVLYTRQNPALTCCSAVATGNPPSHEFFVENLVFNGRPIVS